MFPSVKQEIKPYNIPYSKYLLLQLMGLFFLDLLTLLEILCQLNIR